MRYMRRRRGTYRRRYSRGFRRGRYTSSLIRSPQLKSLQSVHVDIPVSVNVAFTFPANSAFSGISAIPILSALDVGTVSVVGLSDVFTRYASLYDEVKLLSASLSSVMVNYPAGSSSIRLYCMVDRLTSYTDGGMSLGFTIDQMVQSPSTVVRQLNSSQYDYTNMKVYARTSAEKYSWYDSDKAAGTRGLDSLNVRYRGGFSPIFYLALQNSVSSAASVDLSLALRFDIRLSFRGPSAKVYNPPSSQAQSPSAAFNLPTFAPASTLLPPAEAVGVD